MPTVHWTSPSGETVVFGVFSPPVQWNNVPGIYVFACAPLPGQWSPLYVGQTDDFRTRFASHERWPDALREGCTHVLAAVVHGSHARDEYEQQLIIQFRPLLNTVHQPQNPFGLRVSY